MAPVTGGALVSRQLLPPSSEIAVRALFGSAGSRSPPPTIPCQGSRNATVNAPALGELTSGASDAFHVFPPSLVARARAVAAPPVAIHAFLPPWVATQVPLDANENSPSRAGGKLSLMPFHVVPFCVRRSGNFPATESLWAIPRIC